jgi:hypothetical protein
MEYPIEGFERDADVKAFLEGDLSELDFAQF